MGGTPKHARSVCPKRYKTRSVHNALHTSHARTTRAVATHCRTSEHCPELRLVKGSKPELRSCCDRTAPTAQGRNLYTLVSAHTHVHRCPTALFWLQGTFCSATRPHVVAASMPVRWRLCAWSQALNCVARTLWSRVCVVRCASNSPCTSDKPCILHSPSFAVEGAKLTDQDPRRASQLYGKRG